MAKLSPLTVAELESAMADWRERNERADASLADRRAALRSLHDLLVRATPMAPEPPEAAIAIALELAAQADVDAVEALVPRPRTVFRLLRSGFVQPAWKVLTSSAIGVVDQPFHGSTATGLRRHAARLPLLTLVEPPEVFAQLPGFRDPRYSAPDACYAIGDLVGVKHRLDDAAIVGAAIVLGGRADLDLLTVTANDEVLLVLSQGDRDVALPTHRLHRPGSGWTGWSAEVSGDDDRLGVGHWDLSIEIRHLGLVRRARLGAEASDLARAAGAAGVRLRDRLLGSTTVDKHWQLVVS